MAKSYTVHVEAWRTLEYINDIVIPDEELAIGPLTEIACDSNSTMLTFIHDETHPEPSAACAPEQAGKPDLPGGATLIDEGVIFVEGVQTLCAAFRPAG